MGDTPICSCHGLPKKAPSGQSGWRCRVNESQKRNRARLRNNKRTYDEFVSRGCQWENCDINDPDMLTLDHMPEHGPKLFELNNRAKASTGAYRRECEKTQTLCGSHHLKITRIREREIKELING